MAVVPLGESRWQYFQHWAMKIFPKTAFYVATATAQDVLNVKKKGGLLQPSTKMVSGALIAKCQSNHYTTRTTSGVLTRVFFLRVSTAQTSVPAVTATGTKSTS